MKRHAASAALLAALALLGAPPPARAQTAAPPVKIQRLAGDSCFGGAIRVSALIRTADAAKVGLVDETRHTSHLVRAGERAGDIEVISISYEREEVVLRRGTEFCLLRLSGDPEEPAAAPTNQVAAGRGQAIDNFLKEFPNAIQDGLIKFPPPAPPAQGKGEAIERYLREHPELAAQADRPAAGLGAGIEAALSNAGQSIRFDPLPPGSLGPGIEEALKKLAAGDTNAVMRDPPPDLQPPGPMNPPTKYVLCVGVTPALQLTREYARFRPGAVNRETARTRSAAGKAVNVARVLHALGIPHRAVGFIGGDSGRAVLDDLDRLGVSYDFVPAQAPTRTCQTLIDRGGGDVTELVEEAALPTPAEWRDLEKAVAEHVPNASWLVIAGALMPGADIHLYGRMAAMALRHGARVFVDSQREPLLQTLPHRPELVKLNVEELAATTRLPVDSEVNILQAASLLLDRGARRVIVTHGREGAWLVAPGAVTRFRPPPIVTLNPIGSGDAVTAGVIAGLHQGGDWSWALRLGMAAGAANAQTLVAGSVDREGIEALLAGVIEEPQTDGLIS